MTDLKTNARRVKALRAALRLNEFIVLASGGTRGAERQNRLVRLIECIERRTGWPAYLLELLAK
jgi:UDP-N-acetylglucosamine:LPS N-acetylglucosamine transferase